MECGVQNVHLASSVYMIELKRSSSLLQISVVYYLR